MISAGIVVTWAGSLVILVGIVALFRATPVGDDVRRSRAFFVAMCVMMVGFVIGYVGVSIDTGEPPSAAVMAAVVVVSCAGALWRYNVVRAEARRRGDRDED